MLLFIRTDQKYQNDMKKKKKKLTNDNQILHYEPPSSSSSFYLPNFSLLSNSFLLSLFRLRLTNYSIR